MHKGNPHSHFQSDPSPFACTDNVDPNGITHFSTLPQPLPKPNTGTVIHSIASTVTHAHRRTLVGPDHHANPLAHPPAQQAANFRADLPPLR